MILTKRQPSSVDTKPTSSYSAATHGGCHGVRARRRPQASGIEGAVLRAERMQGVSGAGRPRGAPTIVRVEASVVRFARGTESRRTRGRRLLQPAPRLRHRPRRQLDLRRGRVAAGRRREDAGNTARSHARHQRTQRFQPPRRRDRGADVGAVVRRGRRRDARRRHTPRTRIPLHPHGARARHRVGRPRVPRRRG